MDPHQGGFEGDVSFSLLVESFITSGRTKPSKETALELGTCDGNEGLGDHAEIMQEAERDMSDLKAKP